MQTETKYSKQQFEGYTHRFIITFVTKCEPYYSRMTIYSNNGSDMEMKDFIETKKTEKVIAFEISHKASKEQDELDSKFIDEVLNNI